MARRLRFRPRPTEPPVDDDWRPVMRAFGQQLGLALNPERARSWTAAGWCPADAELIAALSPAAVAGGSHLGRQYRADPAGLRKRLGEVVVAWHIRSRLTRGEVLAWLPVLTAAPTATDARAVEDLLGVGRAPSVWRALPQAAFTGSRKYGGLR